MLLSAVSTSAERLELGAHFLCVEFRLSSVALLALVGKVKMGSPLRRSKRGQKAHETRNDNSQTGKEQVVV